MWLKQLWVCRPQTVCDNNRDIFYALPHTLPTTSPTPWFLHPLPPHPQTQTYLEERAGHAIKTVMSILSPNSLQLNRGIFYSLPPHYPPPHLPYPQLLPSHKHRPTLKKEQNVMRLKQLWVF